MTAACPACSGAAPFAAKAAQDAVANVILSLPTIHCAACIGRVESALLSMPGVRSARVNLSLKRVSLATDQPNEDLVARLAAVGFEAHPLNLTALEEGGDREGHALLMRLAVAGFGMMNVMLLSVAVWSGAADATRDLFHLISAMIALPVVAYSGQPFFRNAWSALKVRRLNMDVPISLAILLAAGMSLYETLNGGEHAYFDAALSLTFFLLIGRYLDHRTRGAARSAAKELSALEVHTAKRLVDDQVQTVDIKELNVGDVVLIPTGVRVAVDGDLLSARATTDRSFLTGESDAVALERGASVHAGEINLGAPIRIIATAVAEDTTLRRVAALVETAENARNRYTALADRAARIYAPAVHLLALFAFVGWLAYDGDVRHALNVAIAVLIITCPCALGLAVPAVSSAAIGKLYGLGFLVKSGTALERLAETDTVVFDKTGTLTLPKLTLALSSLSEDEKSIALALAQASKHPVSVATVQAVQGTSAAVLDEVVEVPGKGVQGLWNGQQVRFGSAAWLGQDFPGYGLAVGARIRPIGQAETLRPGVMTSVSSLRGAGLNLKLLSGDRAGAVEAVSKELTIPDAWSAVTAEEKHAILSKFAKEGETVAMVGDGLNDAASLAVAHASIAPSSALDATRNAADVVVLRETFEDLPKVFSIAKKTSLLSRQNFAIAAGYNLIAVPIALAGFATPLLAALAMSASSLTVLLNAMRVRWVR